MSIRTWWQARRLRKAKLRRMVAFMKAMGIVPPKR